MNHAGLGEAAYFLRKARLQITYAQIALDGADPLGIVKNSSQQIDEIIQKIGDAMTAVEMGERELVRMASQSDDRDDDDDAAKGEDDE